VACTISPIVATPEAWVVVRERLRGWSVRWFLLLAAGMANAVVAGTYDC
jgi:hypothetical protein